MDILVRTPIWVWPLLALVVGLGIMQMRERTYSRVRFLILPLVLVGMSLASTATSFGLRTDAFAAWGMAALVALGVNAAIFQWPRGVTHDASTDSYRVAGSIVPLLLILAIFVLRFVVGATLAIDPRRAADTSFVVTICSLLGLCSGLFLARALRVLSTPAVRVAV